MGNRGGVGWAGRVGRYVRMGAMGSPVAGVAAVVLCGMMTAPAFALFSFLNEPFTGASVPLSEMVDPTAPGGSNVACLTASTNVSQTPIPGCGPGPIDSPGSGFLRLTGVGGSLEGGTFAQSSFPNTQGLDISFDSYQWGGTAADGITFVLTGADPTNPQTPLAIGEPGGSLGYAPRNQVDPGMVSGYLGIGLDVFGNFMNGSIADGTGCVDPGWDPGADPNQVTIRGPGSGTAGYCMVNGTANGGSSAVMHTATRSGGLTHTEILINPTGSSLTNGTITVPADSYWAQVTDTTPTVHNVTGLLPSAAGFEPAGWLDGVNVPKRMNFGFVASTGGSTDNHEIQNVIVDNINGVSQPSFSLTNTDNLGGLLQRGGPVTYTLTPSLATVAEAGTVSVSDTFPAGVTPGSASGTGWACSTAGQVVTCSTPGPVPIGPMNAISVPATVTAGASTASGALTTKAEVLADDAVQATTLDPGTGFDATTTTLVSSANPSVYGNTVTFTATVVDSNGGGAPAVGGTVTFGGVGGICNNVATNAGGVATCTITATQFNVAGSPHAVTATYGANGIYLGSTSNTVNQNVSQDATTTTVSVSPTSATYGNEGSSTFSVTVVATHGEAVPNGETVLVSVNGGSATCTVTLAAGAGTCAIANTGLPVGGPYTVAATYGGDANLVTSTGNAGTGLTVSKDTTTTTVSEAPTTVVYGNEATVVYSVTVTTGHGEAVPNGETVLVSVNGGAATCTVTLSAGAGTCSVANTALPGGGPYTIAATYSGDPNLLTSTGSAATGLTVSKRPTTLTVSGPPVDTLGQSVTYTATVSNGGQGTPTGPVAFTLNGTPIPGCSAQPVNGAGLATCTFVANRTGGPFTIAAVYAGDGNFLGSSGSTPFQVGPKGYWLVGRDGGVFAFGGAQFLGSLPHRHIVPVAPIVGIASTLDGNGYWLVGSDGGVFAFGDAVFYGSLPQLHIVPSGAIVGIIHTADGNGYWLVGSDGGVFAFGDAVYYGSIPNKGKKLAAPIVGIAPTADGLGYWLVGADGGIFAYGDAKFLGSLPQLGIRPVGAIVSMVASPDGLGYWLEGSDGGVFAFGDAAFQGSFQTIRPPLHLNAPIIGATGDVVTGGYWICGTDGGVFSFGSPFWGSVPWITPPLVLFAPISGMVATG